ncbi:MAG: hypothetical protein AB7F35_25450 [Acetobacteraceae bacterium]|uniref:hypothetical protein n=1 Tax=Bradyrhizobium sp. TaxID=376 RepID=UPI003D0F6D5D
MQKLFARLLGTIPSFGRHVGFERQLFSPQALSVAKKERDFTAVPRLMLILSVMAIAVLAFHLYENRVFVEPGAGQIFLLLSAYIVTEKIQAYYSAKSEEEIRNDITSTRVAIVETIGNSVETRYIGTHTEALEYCLSKYRSATRIKDTFFRTERDMTLLGHRDVIDQYYRVVLDFIKSGGSMELILSNHNVDTLPLFARDLVDYVVDHEMSVRFQMRSLDHGNAPLINMVIITYNDSREVLFGWNFNNTEDGIVFSSRDEKVIRYFDSLFNEMRSISHKVPLSRTQ